MYCYRYRVSVQTDVDNSVPSEEVEVWAPALPSPHQLVVELQPQNSSFIIYWSLQVEGIAKMPKWVKGFYELKLFILYLFHIVNLTDTWI